MLLKRKCYSTQKFPRHKKLSLRQSFRKFANLFFKPSILFQTLRKSTNVKDGTYLTQSLIYKPEEGWYGEE